LPATSFSPLGGCCVAFPAPRPAGRPAAAAPQLRILPPPDRDTSVGNTYSQSHVDISTTCAYHEVGRFGSLAICNLVRRPWSVVRCRRIGDRATRQGRRGAGDMRAGNHRGCPSEKVADNATSRVESTKNRRNPRRTQDLTGDDAGDKGKSSRHGWGSCQRSAFSRQLRSVGTTDNRQPAK
jgi:hypothetical protein